MIPSRITAQHPISQGEGADPEHGLPCGVRDAEGHVLGCADDVDRLVIRQGSIWSCSLRRDSPSIGWSGVDGNPHIIVAR